VASNNDKKRGNRKKERDIVRMTERKKDTTERKKERNKERKKERYNSQNERKMNM
jgi:hypothetical protein